MQRLADEKVTFFKPFNSAFERAKFHQGKQKVRFNNEALLNTNNMHLSLENKKEVEKHEIVAGGKAMKRKQNLENNGAMKRLFNGFVRNRVKSTNHVSYDKKDFIPFVDERDHLGNLIDSEIRT